MMPLATDKTGDADTHASEKKARQSAYDSTGGTNAQAPTVGTSSRLRRRNMRWVLWTHQNPLSREMFSPAKVQKEECKRSAAPQPEPPGRPPW